MRNTMQPLLCSLIVACAPIGETGNNDSVKPDAGVDDGGTAATCEPGTEIVKTTDITVAGDTAFSNLPTKCWRLNGKLTVNSASVTSLTKLGDLTEVKDLVIEGSGLEAFDTKTTVQVTGGIIIRNNAKLKDIAKVQIATTATSIPFVSIENNAELTNLGGLDKLKIVAGETRIVNNAKLTTANLGSATRLETGLLIEGNPLLTNIDLHALDSVGNFTLRNNAALTTLGSLATLRFVHGSIMIDNNDNLVSLANAFSSNLQRVDVGLSVTGNAKLNDLGGLAQIKYVELGAVFTNNSALNYCEIREIDCCVDTGQVSASGNANNSCGVSGYSWCVQQLGYCPYMQ